MLTPKAINLVGGVILREFLRQIQGAVGVQLYYLALMGALAVPDICGALESENGEADSSKYKKWFDEYLAPQYKTEDTVFLTADDCWRFRCSMLHQGCTSHSRSTYSRIVFTEPNMDGNISHRNVIRVNPLGVTVLQLQVDEFCKEVIDAAMEWLRKHEMTETYKKNYEMFVKRRSDGIVIAGVQFTLPWKTWFIG